VLDFAQFGVVYREKGRLVLNRTGSVKG
jgi:hypothetical protein